MYSTPPLSRSPPTPSTPEAPKTPKGPKTPPFYLSSYAEHKFDMAMMCSATVANPQRTSSSLEEFVSIGEGEISPMTLPSSILHKPEEGDLSTQSKDEAEIEQLCQKLQNAWKDHEDRKTANQAEIVRLRQVIDACDAAFQCLHLHQSQKLPEIPLSQLAERVLRHRESDRRKTELDRLEEKLRAFAVTATAHIREYGQADAIFSSAAGAYHREVECAALWTAGRRYQVETAYRKYCRIMKKAGMEPFQLRALDDYDHLLHLEQSYYDAWYERTEAVKQLQDLVEQAKGMQWWADTNSDMFKDL